MEIVNDRLDDVVMMRAALIKDPVTPAGVTRALRPLAPTSLDDGALSALIEAALARLRAAQRLDERGKIVAGAAPPHFASPTSWKQLVDRTLPGLALDVAAKDARAHKRLSERDHIAAAIVARAHGLWRDGPPPSPALIADAIVWRALELAGPAKRTPPEIRAHFLAQLLGTPSAPPERLMRLLAAREVGAARADLRALRDALARRWLCAVRFSDPAATTASASTRATTPPSTGASGAPTLESFAQAVRDAATRATGGTFGDRKVFIATAWRALRTHPEVGALDLDEFKERLLAAHRAGLVTLARADLAGAMNADDLAASETRHLEARYHFIERGGAP